MGRLTEVLGDQAAQQARAPGPSGCAPCNVCHPACCCTGSRGSTDSVNYNGATCARPSVLMCNGCCSELTDQLRDSNLVAAPALGTEHFRHRWQSMRLLHRRPLLA